MKRRTQELPLRSSRLRFSEIPPPENHQEDHGSETERSNTPTAKGHQGQGASSNDTFTLEIIPSTPTPGSRIDTLPALIGLDTLSLSLPSTRAGLGQDPAGSRMKAKPTHPISSLRITGIPACDVHLLFAAAGLDTGVRRGFWLSVPPLLAEARAGAGGTAGGLERTVRVCWDTNYEELVLVCDEDGGQGDLQLATLDADVKTFDYTRLVALQTASRTRTGNDGTGTAPESVSGHDSEWSSLTRWILPANLDWIVDHAKQSAAAGVKIWPVSTLSMKSFRRLKEQDSTRPEGQDSTCTEEQDSPRPQEQDPPSPTDGLSLQVSTHSEDPDSPSSCDDFSNYGHIDRLNLTLIDFYRTFPRTAVGSERTRWARDRSWYLSSILPADSPPDQPYGQILLAEAASSFLLANLLGNHSSVKHWKQILALGLTCKAAVAEPEKSSLFTALLDTLAVQIPYLVAEPVKEYDQTVGIGRAADGPGPDIVSADETGIFDVHGTDGEELARLLRGFARNLDELATEQLSASTTTGATDANTRPVRAALKRLANAIEATGLDWDISPALTLASTSAFASTSTGQRQDAANESHGLGRRLLRISEGFGDVDDDAAGAEVGDEEDEETGEFAPVVVDLEHVLGGGGEGGEDDEIDGRVGDAKDEEEVDEEEEEMDLRY